MNVAQFYPLYLFRRTTTYDQFIGTLILTSLVAFSRHAPWSNRVLTEGTTLTTTMRVIYRVHRSTANGRTNTTPAGCTSLTELTQSVLAVTNLTNSGTAVRQNLTHFTGTQTQCAVSTFTRNQLSGSSR